MGSYNNMVITSVGQALLTSVLGTQGTLTFSKFQTSSYQYSGGTDLSALTSLNSVQQEVTPSSAGVIDANNLYVSSSVDNNSLATGYTAYTLGIFASDGNSEVLFGVSTAVTPDVIPADTGGTPSTYTYRMQLAVSSTDNITIAVETGAYALATDLQTVSDNLSSHVGSEVLSANGIHGIKAVESGGEYELKVNDNGTWHSLKSTGHIIVDETGVSYTQRSKLKFVNLKVSDDSINDQTVVKGETIQVDTLPTASADELGNVYQYLGTTTSDYTHGYFYECVLKGSTYVWENCRVQDSILYVTPPTVTVGTYTYNGTAQGPTITWVSPSDEANCIVTNATKTNAGSYTLTIVLKDIGYMKWSDESTADKTYNYSIGKITLTVPTVSGSFTYDGTQKSATISGFNSSTMTKSGDTATNAGSYTVTFGLVDSSNYQWNTSPATGSWSIVLPVGSTVTPVNDIQTWLHCIGTSNSYTTISQVLGNTSLLSSLISSSNAVDYMVRSTNWTSSVCANSTAMSYIGLNNYCANTLLANSTWCTAICNSTYFESVLNVKVPTMTSNTTPSGVASASREYYNGSIHDTYRAYWAFDGRTDYPWSPESAGSFSTDWLQYKFPAGHTCKKMKLQILNGFNVLKTFTLKGSNDGSSWTTIYTGSMSNNKDGNPQYFIIPNNNTQYQYYRLDGFELWAFGVLFISELQFYCR